MSDEQKEAMTFLYAYMPLADIADHPGEFYLENVDYANLRTIFISSFLSLSSLGVLAQERINLSGTWQFAFAANQKAVSYTHLSSAEHRLLALKWFLFS